MCMKKIFIGLFFVVLLFGVYLNRAYAHIYSTIQNAGLFSPTTPTPITLVPSTGKPTKDIVYIALGDSLTAGSGVDSVSSTFPYLLAQKIANEQKAKVTLVNLGILGARAEDVLARELPFIQKYHPTLITLVVGVNDIHYSKSVGGFLKNTDSLVNLLVASGAKVVVATVPFVGGKEIMLPPYQFYFDLETKKFNESLTLLMVDKNIEVVDLYTKTHEDALNGTNYYSRDNFHLNAAGYNTWATIFYDAIYR